ncbi:succinate dehydrogenase [Poseidonocella sedimentorum]|uniref:succinate dehydrogenase n=1 Tax=Poseidonocella sedimentorum TaxID=871652 RepID=UPI00116067AD|nr:succinate dehydrogenase [Poseidonocella sedimentorum]
MNRQFLAIHIVVSCFLLSACSGFSSSADQLVRSQAKQAVNNTVAARFPGIDASFATDCIIDAASSDELIYLASSAVSGGDQRTVSKILEIAQRPQSATCIAQNGIAKLPL